MSQIVLDDANRWKALLEMYSQTSGEITRYRDMEWKVLNWTVLLLAGVIGTSHVSWPADDLKIVLKVLTTLFSFVVACYGTWHIHFIHRQLTWNRNQRQKIEEIFEFHKSSIYKTESILKEKWLGRTVLYTSGLPHLISWWLLIWLIASYAVYSIIRL